jgi:ankyrin repeat protein
MKHLLLTTIAANYGFSSIPWWCYLIVFLLLFGFIKKRLGQTIHKHAIGGNIRAIKKLVNSKGMTCLEAKDEDGCSPLHYAALSGHKETVEFLIDNNASVNTSDNGGYTPLHGAAMGGHREIIDLLISKGANLNAKSITGESVLDIALTHATKHMNPHNISLCVGINECAGYLKSLGVGSNAGESIILAAQTGNFEAIKQHLASGVNVNEKLDGATPLSWAVSRGDKEISKYLISQGANIEDVCADGSTLLDVAIFNDDKEIAKVLSGENAKKTCGSCRKIFPYKDVRKLWRFPLFILKLVRMHPGEVGERLYCFRCSCSQNFGTVFLATMFGSLVIVFIVGLVNG